MSPMQYGTIKLRVRHHPDGWDCVQYDTSLFRIEWATSQAPAPAFRIMAHRSPTFIRDGNKLDLYRYPAGEEWIGHAIRDRGVTSR